MSDQEMTSRSQEFAAVASKDYPTDANTASGLIMSDLDINYTVSHLNSSK